LFMTGMTFLLFGQLANCKCKGKGLGLDSLRTTRGRWQAQTRCSSSPRENPREPVAQAQADHRRDSGCCRHVLARGPLNIEAFSYARSQFLDRIV
jgi:hypothetical protein